MPQLTADPIDEPLAIASVSPSTAPVEAPSSVTSLINRLNELRECAARTQRLGDDESAVRTAQSDGATLLLHGEVSFAALPQLEGLLDSVVALGISHLTLDLTDTTGTSPEALRVIHERALQLERLEVIPPSASIDRADGRLRGSHDDADRRPPA